MSRDLKSSLHIILWLDYSTLTNVQSKKQILVKSPYIIGRVEVALRCSADSGLEANAR